MGTAKDIFSAMLVDASPEERARVVRLLFRIIVSVHILWACGFLQPMGLGGFVFAEDVDGKIQSAVEPLRAQLGQITAQLDTQGEIQKRILAGQLAAQIRDLHRLECSTTDEHTRIRMERDVEEAQQEHRALTGERYPTSACKDL